MRKPRTLIGMSVLVAALAVAAIACGGSKTNTSATQTAQYQAPKATQTSTTPKATAATPQATAGTPKATTATPQSTAQGATSGGATVIVTQNATFGKILTDASGKTLYKYANDQPGGNTSNCTGTCAQNWPPLTITSGTPTAGAGVTGALGAFARAPGDTATQVTYDGSPLYYFVSDTAAGDATGDGVGGFSVIKLGG
jgi:predicted lipoprotein with Yx(FWY)xxD motif